MVLQQSMEIKITIDQAWNPYKTNGTKESNIVFTRKSHRITQRGT
jgi:hypothetical protein